MDNIYKDGHNWRASPDLWSAESEDSRGQNMDKGHWNVETSSPYMEWNNSSLEKNSKAEPGLERETFSQ